ncbi:hypothetical protein [Paraburkholderia sp. CNPSo 3281]|uniref:hypothetical protein n=1 Tax=Paraburkholderia sp. CNPSo 3281 TaxID=2940933 RepID=UPI0020B86AFB|nr:hypothetical protein [Paraburkholderia sp. CNPSo 3281]MCP3719118.1 hypothetical protein [Paraburkholderia sp. CNPSo 3281]
MLKLSFWHGGNAQRGILLALRHTCIGRGAFTRKSIVNDIFSRRLWHLLQQLAASTDSPRLNAHCHLWWSRETIEAAIADRSEPITAQRATVQVAGCARIGGMGKNSTLAALAAPGWHKDTLKPHGGS